MRRFVLSSLCVRVNSSIHTSRPRWGRVIPYLLADIGEGIQKVEVVSVCVKQGDKIEEFEKICEVQSDKATVDITSRYTGVVTAVHVVAGETAHVGRPIVDIELGDAHRDDNDGHRVGDGDGDGGTGSGGDLKTSGSPPPPPPKTTTAANADSDATRAAASVEAAVAVAAATTTTTTTTTTTAMEKVFASPATRHFARTLGIDLTQVEGSGAKGRILKEDVVAYARGGGKGDTASDVVVPLTTGIRRAMVASMTEAGSIPSFTACDEMELTKLLALRELLRDAMAPPAPDATAAGGDSRKLSLMPFFLKAASLALLQHPEVNAHVAPDCGSLIVKKAHNIGFAVDTPKGLIVPVVQNVERKTIADLALELNELIAMGRRNQIPPARMRGGTFTLSNIGSIGATYATPIIHPPQVAIAAIGRLQVLPRFDAEGNVFKANIMHVSFTADHRVIDGATLVRFGNTLKRCLESPGLLIADKTMGGAC